MNGTYVLASVALLASVLLAPRNLHAQEIRVVMRAKRSGSVQPRHLDGRACIEDVNHEIYGGIDSQMIFGESFPGAGPAAGRCGIQSPRRALGGQRWRHPHPGRRRAQIDQRPRGVQGRRGRSRAGLRRPQGGSTAV